MAVVLYQGGVSTQTGTGLSRQNIYEQPNDIEAVTNTLETLQADERKKKYIGLANQGATCYMNSLLQSLYMTQEFRQFLYSWKYNEDIHGSKEYCIPYQLQRLFANLQLSRRNYVETKGLTKSFGWDQSDAFEQHDVQELSRKLFDAIEQTFNLAGEQCTLLNDLYNGKVASYVRCTVCNSESLNEMNFQDLSLPIRNEFGTGVQNSSLEMALENYIKPEMLDGDNQYFCDKCQKKVDAEKGLKLTKCPPILVIHLARFTLNWETLQRVKIYDRVTFPFILNMNDYLKGYEGIQNKLYDKEVERMQQFCKGQVEQNVQNEGKRRNHLNEKKEAKEREMMGDEDKKLENGENNNEEVTHIDTSSKKKEKAVKINVGGKEQETAASDDGVDSYNPYLYDASGPRKKKDYSRPECEDDQVNYEDQGTQAEFEGDAYKVTHKNEKFALVPSITVYKTDSYQPNDEEKELAEALEKIREMEEKEVQEKQLMHKENQVLEYLLQGDLVYELYAVLIHSGSALGGHYYAYIKSFEDGKWYNYNDSDVKEIKVDDIQNVFGDKNGNATAYMLKYRQYNPDKKENPDVIPNDAVPEYLKTEIDTETSKMIQEQLEIEQKLMSLKVKLWWNDVVKEVTMKRNELLSDLANTAIDMFEIKDIKMKNFRLRAYDPKLKAKMEVYDHMDVQLHKCNIHSHQDLLIEIKLDDEDFEEYNSSWLYLRVVKYVEGQQYDFSKLDTLQWQVLRVDKKLETVRDMDNKIAEMFDIPPERLIVLMRHEQIYNNTVRTELYNIEWRKSKKIEDASRIDHGTILYVEEGDPKGQLDHFKWHQEFTKDQDRLILHLNDPINDPDANIFDFKIEMRKDNTLYELKQRVSELTGLATSEFVLKRNMVQREYKQMNSKLSELGLNSGALIKVQLGKPHQDGVYELNINKVTLLSESESDDTLFVKEFMFKMTIDPTISAIEFKHKILDQYSTIYPGHSLDVDKIRARNPKGDDLGDVIKDQDTLENQYLFDDKDIYMQVVDDKCFCCVNELNPNNALHILIREWDPEAWTLGPLYEIKVDRNINTSNFAKYLSEHVFPHIPTDNLFWTKVNVIRNFKRGDLALKKWHRIKSSAAWLGQAAVEINKDAVYLIVKDNEKKIREELTPEEITKYASQAFIDHINKKYSSNVEFQHKDPLFQAAASNKIDYSKNRRLEKGIKITVGGPQNKEQSVVNNKEGEGHSSNQEKEGKGQGNRLDKVIMEAETEDDEETNNGGVYIEALF